MNFRAANLQAASTGLLSVATLILGMLCCSSALAELPIELDVAMQSGLPITAPQEWAKRLGQLDLRRVQLRSARADDKPTISITESSPGPRIKIVAILTQDNELVLPKHRYPVHKLPRLKTYLERLAKEGAEVDAQRGRFGLTEKQFNAAHANLVQLIDFSTTELTTAQMLSKLEQKFLLQVIRDKGTKLRLQDYLVGIELHGLTTGTALAIALRQEGLAFHPEKPREGPVQIRVHLFDPDIETWPVGWKPQGGKRQTAPKLFDSLTVEITNYTLAQALEALAPRIGIPLILDQWMLEQREIDPDKIEVEFPRRKTYLKRAVDKVLSQAHLAGELRVDEFGTPFYWVTQYGKNSLRAE